MTIEVIRGLNQIALKVIPITNGKIQEMLFAINIVNLAIPNASAEDC